MGKAAGIGNGSLLAIVLLLLAGTVVLGSAAAVGCLLSTIKIGLFDLSINSAANNGPGDDFNVIGMPDIEANIALPSVKCCGRNPID